MDTLNPSDISNLPAKPEKPKKSKADENLHKPHHGSHQEPYHNKHHEKSPDNLGVQLHGVKKSPLHLKANEPQEPGEWPCLPCDLEITTMPIIRSNQPVGVLTVHVKHIPSGKQVQSTLIGNYSRTLVQLLKEIKEQIGH